MPPLRIGKLAELANVNVQTLRFYERRGILPKPVRRPSGYREYPSETVGLVRLIKHVQGLGFSLKEIKGFLALRKSPSATLESATAGLASKIEEVDAKIQALTAVRGILVQMLETHRQRADVPFVQMFDSHVEKLAREAIGNHSQPQLHGNHAAPAQKKNSQKRAGGS